jgi:hypothetical protein
MNTITYTKTITDLGQLRDALFKSNLLYQFSNVVDIISIVITNTTTVSVTYDKALTTDQATAITLFITNYVETARTEILKVATTNKVTIKEESKEGTNGSFAIKGINFDAPLNGDGSARVTQFPFLIDYMFTGLLATVYPYEEMNGDEIEGFILPQNATAVGAATADIADGATIIHVQQTVIGMVEPEKIARIYITSLGTGISTDKVQVKSVDWVNNTIELEEPINMENGVTMLAADTLIVYLENNIVGAIVQPVTVNNRWIYCDPGAIEYLLPGRFINLFQNSLTKTELREITECDKVNYRVRIKKPFNIAMSPADATTYIQLTLEMIQNMEINSNFKIPIGKKTIGGASLEPSNRLIISYKNKGAKLNKNGISVSTKRVITSIEILY